MNDGHSVQKVHCSYKSDQVEEHVGNNRIPQSNEHIYKHLFPGLVSHKGSIPGLDPLQPWPE